MKIALLVIATNKYTTFTFNLWDSVKKYFLPNHDVDMFIFTNNDNIPDGTKKIYQEHFPWPYPTLMRYHIFSNSYDILKSYDAHYYCDADMLFVNPVGDEILGDIVATLHPGFYAFDPSTYSYETRTQSVAYVSPHERNKYYAGGFNGGFKYLNMASDIAKMVDHDTNNGIVAVWHDESYLNRYLVSNPPTISLTPDYCFPDQQHQVDAWKLNSFTPKLLALTKNHSEIRS